MEFKANQNGTVSSTKVIQTLDKTMTHYFARRLASVVFLAVLTFLTGCCALHKKHCHQVIIIVQPEDQDVPLGSNATFSVLAAHGPPYTTNGLSYQWQENHTPFIAPNSTNWTDISCATNASYTLMDVQLPNVGHYRVKVSGSPTETSRAAALTASTGGGGGGAPITVYGPPAATTGNSNPPYDCPGGYAGSVSYKKTVARGWGWTKATSPHSAADGTSRTNTKVEMSGLNGNRQCDLTPVSRSTLPDPKYRFAIYFPSNVPSTNAYPIVLGGFNP